MTDAEQSFPKAVNRPALQDIVQVVMTEEMARLFESRCLGSKNTRGNTVLSEPVQFSADGLPTYIIGLR